MKNSKLKFSRGFTLIEAVILIAIVAVLSAILIPTYSNLVKKANITMNMQIASEMNSIVLKHESDIKNVQDVVYFLNEAGFSIEKLNPTANGHRFVWEEKSGQILLLNEKLEVVPNTNIRVYNSLNWKLWLIVKNPSELISTSKMSFNYYLANDYNGNFEIKTLSTFETGKNIINGNVVYLTSSQGDATFSGIVKGTISINAPNATIHQFGIAEKISVSAVGYNSLNINGYVENLEIKNGKIELKSASYVKNLNFITGEADSATFLNGGIVGKIENNVLPESVSFTNETGFVEKIPDELSAIIQNPENYKAQIDNLKQLETFRTAVNYGANFLGITVQLTSNITLTDGWVPIGEFARIDVEKLDGDEIIYNDKIVGFAGTFDGNNKTISNLNNKNYVPDATKTLMKSDSTIEGKSEFAYGFFGITTDATIKSLKITNINIDIPLNSTYGDSVGAIIGCAVKDLSIINCETTGSLKAYDAVGGLVGRSCFANQIIFNNCKNNVKIFANQKAGGFLGFAEKLNGENQLVQFSLCLNLETVNAGTGNIKTKDNIAISAGFTSYASSINAIYNFIECENHGYITTNYTYDSEKAYANSFIINIIGATINKENVVENGIIKINGIVQD